MKVLFDQDNPLKVKLHEEQLDISKKLVQKGKVTMQKEVLKEEKNIAVSVTREELVIKRQTIDKDDPDNMNKHMEVIRIPVREERIEVIKHPVIHKNFTIYKCKLHGIEHIQETIKKEDINIKTTGNPKIINEDK